MRRLLASVRVRFVDGFVGVSDARLFHSRSVAYKCYWLARDVFGYGEESARVAYMAGWCHDAGYAFAPTQLDHAEAGGVILVDAGASFADAVRSHGDPDVPAMSDLLLIVNTADMMCGPDGVPVSFGERLSDVEARYGAGSRQAVDVGAMLSVLRRELEMRGVSVVDAERAGVERVDVSRDNVDAADSEGCGRGRGGRRRYGRFAVSSSRGLSHAHPSQYTFRACEAVSGVYRVVLAGVARC